MRTSARRRTPGLALFLAPLLLLAACSGGESSRAVDGGAAPTAPTQPPVADGLVRTRDLVVVIDTGEGPQMCLGPVTRSYPPQCTGPAVEGWRWRDQQAFEKAGDVRWGSFALTGTWDGSALTVTEAIPAALYDTVRQDETDPPPPLRQRDEASIAEIAGEVSTLPGVESTYVENMQVVAEVVYDDGSLQEHVDQTYGANSVRVVSELVDAG